MADLDPDGVHLLDPVMYHENTDDMRTWAYLKMRGQDEPAKLTLDVPSQIWDTLPSTEVHAR